MTEPQPSWITKTSSLITLACTLAGTVLAYLALAAAVDWPPFSDDGAARQVTVYKGNGCTNGGNCAHIGIELTGFPANSEVVCRYESSVGPVGFTDEIVPVDNAGHGRKVSNSNVFWDPSGTGWVAATCGGVRGIRNPW